jgi:DNA-binding transcriptional MerR regulator
MPEPPRSEGDRRLYTEPHQRRLAFIRHARELGFEMADIRALLDLADRPEMSCAQADVIARAHLLAVEEKIARLVSLRTELERMVTSCAQGQVATCRVIESLADHAHREHH